MFNYTKADLAALAEEYNFVRDTLEKVLRLADILTFINSNADTQKSLCLKGGTAINLTVFNLPRLSVDIDLDFCGALDKSEMLSRRQIITSDIKKYMFSQGYALSPQSKEVHSLDSFVFSYTNSGGSKDNIKVEINYSLRSHIFEPKERTVLPVVLSNELKVFALEPVELFAAKTNALLSRAAARDLYDTYNLVHFGLLDDQIELLRKCVIIYTVISQETISDTYDIAAIDRISFQKIKTDLLPVIKRGTHIDLEAIKKDVKQFLTELLVLSDDEKQFLELFKQKIFRPELVIDDEKIIERLNAHPMIKWKLMQ